MIVAEQSENIENNESESELTTNLEIALNDTLSKEIIIDLKF